VFKPDFDDGINVVENDAVQKEGVGKYLALSTMPYTSSDLKDPVFINAVRNDQTGC
jgi:hypothetical protein